MGRGARSNPQHGSSLATVLTLGWGSESPLAAFHTHNLCLFFFRLCVILKLICRSLLIMNPPSIWDIAGVFFQLQCLLLNRKKIFFPCVVCVLKFQFKKPSPKQKSQRYFPAQSSVSFVILFFTFRFGPIGSSLLSMVSQRSALASHCCCNKLP